MNDLATLDMGGKVPRWYQVRTVEECRKAIAAGDRNLIIGMATGSGKTVTACMLIKLANEKDRRAVFIAPSRELIKQTSAHLYDCGVDRHGIIMAGFDPLEFAPVQIASKDTLAARTLRRLKMELPPADLLVIDECRASAAPEYRRLIESFKRKNPNLIIVGLDATPARADGKGLGDVYDRIITCATYQELIGEGFLVPVVAYGWEPEDMSDVNGVTPNQWEEEAAKRADKPKLVGDVVQHWIDLAQPDDRKTIVFCQRVAHSVHLRDEFIARGVAAEHVDGGTSIEDRDAAVQALKSGDIQVLTNVGCFVAGFDEPQVSCIVLASPTRSLVKYRQCTGRALRPCPEIGKKDCLLIDHSGAVAYFGMFPDEDVEWTLEKTRNVQKELEERRHETPANREPRICENCHCQFKGRRDCPNCGQRVSQTGKQLAIRKGFLKPLKRKKRQQPVGSLDDKIACWHQCLAVMAHRGQTLGAAAGMYKTRTKEMPWDTAGLPNLPPPGKANWAARVTDVYPQYVRAKK